MKIRHSLLIASAIIVATALGAAHADLTYTQGSGTTIFDFVCFTTKHCSAHVPVNSAGTEIGTSGAPIRTDPTGTTTQPVSAASLPLPTGAATSANQSSQITQETATATGVGAPADVAYAGSGSASIIAAIKGVYAAVSGSIPAGTNSIGTVQPGNTPNTVPWLTTDSATSATGSAAPAKAAYTGVIDAVGGNLAGLTGDPCQTSVKDSLPITLATAAVKVIAPGVSAKKIYVCAIDITNNAADSVAIFEATTGTTCATAAVAVAGAGTSVATAAQGYNFAANGGISKGGGGFQVMKTTVNNNDLCVAQNTATQLTGNITYVTR